ncbi:hypothetical protein [Alkaliphilus sp. B6464]|uniref:hypothetical protein n=1 Tax=Alkaliphilus sp. B6464 TaxID=2731219 RepID=UPI001BAC26A4|nr:hypothetical protein [Alkaliphilus sp. B6464]QUH19259.1 hypothetical protein HYG84_04700 [Alkaliphilus sp. B6464]
MKTVVTSVAAITLCSTVFAGANNVAMAMALDKEESIYTTYNVSTTFIDKAEDYVKETTVPSDHEKLREKYKNKCFFLFNNLVAPHSI